MFSRLLAPPTYPPSLVHADKVSLWLWVNIRMREASLNTMSGIEVLLQRDLEHARTTFPSNDR